MLEELVEELLKVQETLAGLEDKIAKESLPLSLQQKAILERYDTAPAKSKIADLKAQILVGMPEKTVRFLQVTLTKRISRRLDVLDGNALFESLRAMPAVLAKVTHSFTRCKIIDLVDAGAITLGSEAEIVASESLVIKRN